MASILKETTHLVHDRFLAMIEANPGIHIRQLSLLTGLSWNTCQHHLRTMQRNGLVTDRKIEGKVCWYDCTHGAVRGKSAAFLLRDPQNLALAQKIVATPGHNQRQFAKDMGLAPSIIHRRVIKLEEAGLVERVAGGRSMAVYPSQRLEAMADNDRPREAQAVTGLSGEARSGRSGPDVMAVSLS